MNALPHALHFIINPASGRFGARRLAARLAGEARSRHLRVDVHWTQGPGDARCFAERIATAAFGTASSARRAAPPTHTDHARSSTPAEDRRPAAIVVCGGDGTVQEVVSGLPVSPQPPAILVVPTGTENLLAKYLGMRADADSFWKVFSNGRTVVLDVPAMNGREFVLVAGIGFDAEVVRRLVRQRRRNITHWAYASPLWRTFWAYRQPQLSVRVDGKPLFDGHGLVFVANVPRYALGLRILPHADPTDGLLDVCVFECAGRRALIGHALNVLLRRRRPCRGVVIARGSHILVNSREPAGIELDGEWAGYTPAELRSTPKRVTFYAM